MTATRTQTGGPMASTAVAEGMLSLTTDEQGLITWCSSALEQLTGYPAEALVGRRPPLWLFDLDEVQSREQASGVAFGPALFALDPRRFDRRRVRVDLGRHERRRGTASREPQGDHERGVRTADWTIVTRDGERLVLSLSVHRMPPREEHAAGYLVRAVDVTAERATRRLLAQALEREQVALRRLEEVGELRKQFVTTASHELRTPLTCIRGYLDLLAEQLDDGPANDLLLSRLRRNVDRIQHLADQLLLVADEQEGGPRLEPLDLRSVVAPALADLDLPGQEVSVSAAAAAVPVRGDRAELTSVLVQLLDNALKFAGPAARITCTIETREGRAVLEVVDDGPGMTHSERERAFDAFFRGTTAVEQGVPGGGVGLSLVQRLVARHGGEVRISACTPRGTVVSVLLPLEDEDEEQA